LSAHSEWDCRRRGTKRRWAPEQRRWASGWRCSQRARARRQREGPGAAWKRVPISSATTQS
jgi:hypothetical protein